MRRKHIFPLRLKCDKWNSPNRTGRCFIKLAASAFVVFIFVSAARCAYCRSSSPCHLLSWRACPDLPFCLGVCCISFSAVTFVPFKFLRCVESGLDDCASDAEVHFPTKQGPAVLKSTFLLRLLHSFNFTARYSTSFCWLRGPTRTSVGSDCRMSLSWSTSLHSSLPTFLVRILLPWLLDQWASCRRSPCFDYRLWAFLQIDTSVLTLFIS